MTFSWLFAQFTQRKSTLSVPLVTFLVLITFLFSAPLFAQEEVGLDQARWDEGRSLFRSNCGACHHPVNDGTGPALYDARQRWIDNADFEGVSGEEWFYKWIKNNVSVLETGHTYANQIFKEYNQSPMNLFPALTNEEIDGMFYYVQNHDKGGGGVTAESDAVVVAEDTFPFTTFLIILVVGLLIVVLILARVSKVLDNLAKEKAGEPIPDAIPFWQSNKLKTLVSLAIFVFIGYFLVSNATALGRQQAYEPDQPIKYDHALHAGKHKIECQYCHSGANESKHSNIPSINVCMNCHKNIQQGPTYGRTEISKIYAAIAYDPIEGKYIDTDNVSTEEVEKVLKQYMMQDYLTDSSTEEETAEAMEMVNDDLETTMAMYNRPVEWVRIHNLPDHVYFNHAQHVNAGNVACQTCHGNIQEMEVVAQHAPLSMGWCINCHRNTEVDFQSNEYYSVYEKYHEDLSSGAIDKVTVEDIGGTECQKCHY